MGSSEKAEGFGDEVDSGVAAIRSVAGFNDTQDCNPVTPLQGGQAVGECDSESELPCSFPRRKFKEPPESLHMPATATGSL